MVSNALLIIHQTKPEKRDEVKAIWLKYMASAIQDNAGHLAYFYNFDNNNVNSIYAFQVYESEQAAKDFLLHPSYQTYLIESRHLLENDPQIISLTPQWVKVI
ncbi:antibiotic biosynthesis monooxygenase [Psychrobacter sp. YGAH215]|uniref:putative quinol monooxygenase n=1 Tax=Psychrobacter sp. YGAH215 TaxID=2596826 RepID=UPI0011859D83|nr:antibiotic biosynthesis monooxygenase [Psychrobacter sp. YGAH215]TSB22007.1 antibiotic biosynthesis monooxygenase [Psychrobacter sp. YGAH215]